MNNQNSLKTFDAVSENLNIKTGAARFNFKNGDSYEGKYQIDIGKHVLVKQG